MSTENAEIKGALEAFMTEVKNSASEMHKNAEEKGQKLGQDVEKVEKMIQALDSKMSAVEARMARSNASSEANLSAEKKLQEINPVLKQKNRQEIKSVEQFNEIESLINKSIRLGEKTLSREEYKTIESMTDGNGGYLIVPQWSNEMVKREFDSYQISTAITNTQIVSDTWKEIVDWNDYSSSTYEDQITDNSVVSDEAFKEISITVGEQYYGKKFSRTQLEDAQSTFESEVMGAVSAGMVRKDSLGVLNGLGNTVNPLKGLLTYTAGTGFGQIQQVTSFANDAIAWDDVLELLPSALKDPYHANAKFGMRRATFFKLLTAIDSQNKYQIGNQIQFLSTSKVTMSILGYPVLFDAGMPAVGNGTLAVAFGDFARAYRKVNRVGFGIHRDESNPKFVTLTGRSRCGGGVKDFEAVKLLVIQ